METKKGDREQYELLVLKKELLLASALSSEARMTRMSATGHQKAATLALWRERGTYWKRRRVQGTLCIQFPDSSILLRHLDT